jgi:rhodanese-related sulfurtransferase
VRARTNGFRARGNVTHCAGGKVRYDITMKLHHALLPFVALFTSALAADAPKISATEAARRIAAGDAVLVDCREPGELKESGIAAPATSLPKSDFDGDKAAWNEFLARNRGKEVIIYCRSGARSGVIANALNEKGVKAANAGGLKDWTAAGLPTRAVDAPPAKAKP